MGNRDSLLDLDFSKIGCKVVCFSDQLNESRLGVEYVKTPLLCDCPVRTARFFKVFPHLLFPDAEYSIWFDNNFKFRDFNPRHMVTKYLSCSDLATYAHPERDCAYEEINACIKLKRDEPGILESQRDFYQQEGLPDHAGLISSGLLVRRHTPELADFMGLWWDQLRRFSRRDQVSFTYARWKLGFKYKIIPGSIWSNEYFEWVPHSGAESRPWLRKA